MEEVRTYILRVVTTAMITAVIDSLSHNSSFRPVLRLVCGVFLSGVILQPLSGGIPEIQLNWTANATSKAQDLAEEGSQAAQSAMEEIITEELEAYILDKAANMDTSVAVEIKLNDQLLPVAAKISGAVTTSAKKELMQLLEEELGIPKENQAWTG